MAVLRWARCVAAGMVRVYETDSVLPEQPSFERGVAVKFPDKMGYGPDDYSQVAVSSTILKRFVDRSSWLFYTHEEKYYPDY